MALTMMIEVHASDYRNIEQAAKALGYSNIELIKLSTHLIASAVIRGERVVFTPVLGNEKQQNQA